MEHILKQWQEKAFAKSKRTSQLQACVILLNVCMNPGKPYVAEIRYLSSFRKLLEDEQSPRNRFLIEWAILRICSVADHGKWMDVFLELLEKSDPLESNATEIASYVKIVLQMVLHLPDNMETSKQISYSTRLLTVLTTLVNTTKVAVRFTAQASFPTIYEHIRSHNLLDKIPAAAVFTCIYSFITKLGKYAEPPEENIWSAFDIGRDMNLATLFEGGYLYAWQSEAPLLWASDLREVEREVMEAGLDGGHAGKMEIGEVNGKVRDLIARKKAAAAANSDAGSSTKNGTQSTKPMNGATATSAPLQTKSLALDLKSLGLDAASLEEEVKQGTGPILIGTLVDAPVNIGGLSRAANVFGCHSLHIPKSTMLKDKSFKTTSLDSELHLRIEETKPVDLATRLLALKEEGWSIVGLEQTSNSIVIGEPAIGRLLVGKKLPQKAVIVMGAESTGIPADILVLCDRCVEIKQWGITRSLNVQTAAAVVLFEWRREWGDGKNSVAEP
jgi:tRNA guanosine-2'-O-methyltransferase